MILFLEPYFETKPWAGNKLNSIYDCPKGTGEAWIISGYRGKSSIIKNGQYKGQTLYKLWHTKPQLFGNYNEKEFPLLIKIIDAKENLSVQVHPDDEYALKKHNSLGKFECWYFLNGTTSKSVVCDLSIDRNQDIRSAIENNYLENFLIHRPIKENDLVVIEPGTVHALEAGSFLLEVQESSDVTYRLYDYNRLPKRKLHIEDSLNVIVNNSKRNPIYSFDSSSSFKNSHFNMHKVIINGDLQFENKGFELFYVLEGNGIIDGTKIKKGDSFIMLPKQKESFIIEGDLSIIAIVPKQKQERLDLMRKTAFITAIIGQDGIMMANYLLDKGYEVHGMIQTFSQLNSENMKYFDKNLIDNRLFFHLGDLADSSNINRLIERIRPDEIYHLAGQNHVDSSFDLPEYTTEVNSLGTLRILDAIKESSSKTKMFNMSTCQLYSGDISPQDEDTPFEPKSPYAVSKLYAHYMVKNYRETYNLYAVNGICYNHDSKIEKNSFFYRKIVSAAKAIKRGEKIILEMGNLDAVREWGNTYDYCEAMWLSLQQNKADDYVIGFDYGKTIREWIKLVYENVGIKLTFEGTGLDEVGKDQNGNILIKVNPKYFRPNDAKILVSNAKKFREKTGWSPKCDSETFIKTLFEE